MTNYSALTQSLQALNKSLGSLPAGTKLGSAGSALSSSLTQKSNSLPAAPASSVKPAGGGGGGGSMYTAGAANSVQRQVATDYLKSIGYSNPDEGEIQGAISTLGGTGQTAAPTLPPPVTPVTTPAAPTDAYQAPDISSSYNVYDNLMNFLLKPEEQQDIRDKFTGLGQPLIENIQTQTSLMMADAKRAANELLARNRALMSRSGLSGSQFDTRSIADAQKYNAEQEKRIQADQDKKILDVTKEMTTMSENIIAKNKEMALQAANLKADTKMTQAMKGLEAEYTTTSINKMKQDIKNSMESLKMENAEKSLSMAAYLAKSGVEYDKLPFSTLSALKDSTGLNDDALKLYMNYNKEAGQRIDYKVEKVGDTLVFAGIDPKTGKPSIISHSFPTAPKGPKIEEKIVKASGANNSDMVWTYVDGRSQM
jgi:hypothetical protein